MTALALRFVHSSIGRKYVMAVTGLGWFVFLVLHLYSNLQVFAGQHATNTYYASLKASPFQLWGIRGVLFAGFVLHVVLAIAVMLTWRRARAEGYARYDAGPSTYAARTMAWTGPILGFYIVWHLLHLSVGYSEGFVHGDVYNNIVRGLAHPAVAITYLLAVASVCAHLLHGITSALRSLGLNDAVQPLAFRIAAAAIPMTLFLGFAAIPAAILAGVLQPT